MNGVLRIDVLSFNAAVGWLIDVFVEQNPRIPLILALSYQKTSIVH